MNSANQLKHGVHLADATGVLKEPGALTREAAYPPEALFVTIRRDLPDRVRVVASPRRSRPRCHRQDAHHHPRRR